jgi:hypothetical protein
MINDCVAGFTRAGHDVDDAIGKFHFLQNLGQMQRSDRSRFRRLQHTSVSTGQPRRELPGRHSSGKFQGTIWPATPSGRTFRPGKA